MSPAATRMTAEEYLARHPEPDGRRRELIDGVVVVNEPRLIHGLLHVRLLTALQRWIEDGAGRGLALPPADVVMDEHNVFAPDLLWLSEARVPDDLHELLAHVPDLAIEIRSPSTWHFDVGRKKATYEARGLPELWLVDDRARTVLVFRRSKAASRAFDVALELAEGEVLSSPQLPGFGPALADLFAPHRR